MTTTNLADLERRLRRLEDIEVARGVYQVYAEALDVPDATTAAALFAEDGVLRTARGEFQGRVAIRDFYARLIEADPTPKRHFIMNPRVVEATSGLVRLQSYFLFVGRGPERSVIGWGTYDDLVDVTGDQPVFRDKAIELHLSTDLATGWAAEGER